MAVLAAGFALLLPHAAAGTEAVAAPVPAGADVHFLAACALPMTPPVAPPASNAGISQSALNAPTPLCSAIADTNGTVRVCSAGSLAGFQRCSIRTDANDACSAFGLQAGAIHALCSALTSLARVNSFCSVFATGPDPGGNDASCSAFAAALAEQVECSVGQPGAFQFCSVQQGAAVFRNRCSAVNSHIGAPNAEIHCSVLDGFAERASCSTFGAGAVRTCSALTPGAACSVRIDPAGHPAGKCTSLRGASGLTCSVEGGSTSTCSVIGGASGDPCGSN